MKQEAALEPERHARVALKRVEPVSAGLHAELLGVAVHEVLVGPAEAQIDVAGDVGQVLGPRAVGGRGRREFRVAGLVLAGQGEAPFLELGAAKAAGLDIEVARVVAGGQMVRLAVEVVVDGDRNALGQLEVVVPGGKVRPPGRGLGRGDDVIDEYHLAGEHAAGGEGDVQLNKRDRPDRLNVVVQVLLVRGGPRQVLDRDRADDVRPAECDQAKPHGHQLAADAFLAVLGLLRRVLHPQHQRRGVLADRGLLLVIQGQELALLGARAVRELVLLAVDVASDVEAVEDLLVEPHGAVGIALQVGVGLVLAVRGPVKRGEGLGVGQVQVEVAGPHALREGIQPLHGPAVQAQGALVVGRPELRQRHQVRLVPFVR